MIDLAQLADQVVELLIGEQKRVAARHQDVAHLGVLCDPAQTIVHVEVEAQVAVHHQFLAEAVTAVDAAVLGHGKGHTVFVLACDAVGAYLFRGAVFLPHQVVGFAVFIDLLLGRGDDLLADRTIGIVRVHQRSDVGCRAPGGPVILQRFAFCVCEVDEFFERFSGVDELAQLLLPFLLHDFSFVVGGRTAMPRLFMWLRLRA